MTEQTSMGTGPEAAAAPHPEKTRTIATASARTMPAPEFIALMAWLSAITALSLDAMLPAFPAMVHDLGVANENRIQLVLAVFSVGMGLGTLFVGPIADWLGRRRTIFIGFGIYFLASLASALSPTLEVLLASRFVMGLGAAAVRIAGLAMIRDLYVAREMARIISFVMMAFMIVPALAPMMGEWVILIGDWRMIFYVFMLFALAGAAWLHLRQPETLPVEYRRPMSLRSVVEGVREVLAERQIVLCAVAMTLGYAQLFSLIMSSQQLFTETYDQGAHFTRWFALMALLSGAVSLVNARLVMVLGMRRIVNIGFGWQVATSILFLVLLLGGVLPAWLDFPVFFLWAVGLMGIAGLTFGNLNAIAMQYKGNIAGTTASVISAISVFFSAFIAAGVGQAYNGTVVPLVLASLVCSALALAISRRLT